MQDDRPVIWLGNYHHVIEEHTDQRPTFDEVNEAMTSPARVEEPDPDRPGYVTVLAEVASGRMVFVAWADHPQGRFPVHARYADRRTRRRYGS